MKKQKYKIRSADFLGILADFLVGNSQPTNFGTLAELFSTRKNLARDIKRFKDRGWIEVAKKGPKIAIKLTTAGKLVVNSGRLEKIKLEIPTRWDGKWRVVIFDIPETQRIARNAFRSKIKSLGFVQIQQSVWVWPYKCLQELAEVAVAYEVESFVSLLEGKYIGDDRHLRKKFNLP